MCIHTVIHHLQYNLKFRHDCSIKPTCNSAYSKMEYGRLEFCLCWFHQRASTRNLGASFGFIWILFQVGFFVYRGFIVAHLGCSNYFLDITHFINFMTLLWDRLNFSQKLPPKWMGVSQAVWKTCQSSSS